MKIIFKVKYKIFETLNAIKHFLSLSSFHYSQFLLSFIIIFDMHLSFEIKNLMHCETKLYLCCEEILALNLKT